LVAESKGSFGPEMLRASCQTFQDNDDVSDYPKSGDKAITSRGHPAVCCRIGSVRISSAHPRMHEKIQPLHPTLSAKAAPPQSGALQLQELQL
jgi:hypothetical protein